MRAVFLDFGTVDHGDMTLTALRGAVDHLHVRRATDSGDIARRAAGFDIVLTNKLVFDADVFAACPDLRLLCLAATGTDNVDLGAARAHGVAVCNITDYCSDSVAQHVFALILTLSRNLDRYRALVANGAWTEAQEFCLLDDPIRDLSGLVLGIVGFGSLGRRVARLGEAFGMQVQIAARVGEAAGPGRVAFGDLLGVVDVLSLHCPLTDRTRGMLGRAELARMKTDAVVINTGRGALIDGDALYAALAAGRLGGAGIDVLPTEPPPADDPLLRGGLANLIVTPHVAWASRLARQRAVDEMARNVAAFAAGERRNRVA